MARPELVRNEVKGQRHHDALAYLVADIPGHPLAVATGYVNLEGLHHLATLADGRPTRLLVGAQPGPALGADLSTMPLFDQQLRTLSRERNLSRFPPSRAAERLADVERWIARDEVRVRRYAQRFLHGKAYLFGTQADGRAALITSANLTAAGLLSNLELGLVDYQPGVTAQAIAWFDRLWDEAVDFEDELQRLLFPDPGLIDPETVYKRSLLELMPPQPDDLDRATRPVGLHLAPFQRDGYERARAIAGRHGGVVYADGVGTGKTEIGLAFIEERTKESGVHALVVAPAQLARRWRERIHLAKLPAEVITFQQLADDEQLTPNPPGRRHLATTKDAYRLIVVDEAHALRNDGTTWYRAMTALMGGSDKQLVLLTATPINNGLWDLYNLVMLFAGHDRAFAGSGIDSIRDLFVAAGAGRRDPEDLDPDVLFPLADAVSVRRDRQFIEREYRDATFPNGVPVRFPEPQLHTIRYDLDAAHPGLFNTVADAIAALTMARYRPSAYEIAGDESAVETQLGGLLKSGVLKRFESCWRACLETVEAMITAHDAFLVAWRRGEVLDRDTLRQANLVNVGDTGLANWIDERLDDGMPTRPAAEFLPEYAEDVGADRDHLATIRDALRAIDPADDPKLAALRDLLKAAPDRKIAVFATYAATVRYLDEQLPRVVGGRARVTVIGNTSTPDERMHAIERFAPHSVVGPDHAPAAEVDLLLSTDVLSEGQNLQQAQAVVSYDMPWNPQRVVQRNGRVIRLLSPHERVNLTTMLPVPGELDRLLGLEARIRMKIKAASGVYGMESAVLEGIENDDLRAFAERIAAGDVGLLDEAEDESGAFIGEELRRVIDRAAAEGEVERLMALPWGVGARLRLRADADGVVPGVFFACRTPAMQDAEDGYRYWRYVETTGDRAIVRSDLEILRRIDPARGDPDDGAELDLEAAWSLAAADIVSAHNERADLRRREQPIGPRQEWALRVLGSPGVALPDGADEADEALSVARSSAVRAALAEVEARLNEAQITTDQAAEEIVDAVRRFGLRGVEAPPLPETITADDLGVVCWMGVLAPAGAPR